MSRAGDEGDEGSLGPLAPGGGPTLGGTPDWVKWGASTQGGGVSSEVGMVRMAHADLSFWIPEYPPPQVWVSQIPAPISGSLVNQESKPAEGWGIDCPPKPALTQSAASVAGLSQTLYPGELSHTGAPCTPTRPAPPRLPVPAARLLLAGAAPAWTEVPGWVPSCLR